MKTETGQGRGDGKGAIPPYVSYLTFVTFLDWWVSLSVTPSQIDRSLWESKFSGSTGIQLVAALKFMKLLEGNIPTPCLKELTGADSERRQELIRQILRDAYGSEWVENLGPKTPKMLDDRLRELGTTEATHRKAISFFINACKSNGVLVPPAIAKRARIKPSKPKGQKSTLPPKPASKVTIKSEEKPFGNEGTGSEQSIELKSGGTVAVKASVDLFRLSTEDREFVFKLIDLLKSYGSTQKG